MNPLLLMPLMGIGSKMMEGLGAPAQAAPAQAPQATAGVQAFDKVMAAQAPHAAAAPKETSELAAYTRANDLNDGLDLSGHLLKLQDDLLTCPDVQGFMALTPPGQGVSLQKEGDSYSLVTTDGRRMKLAADSDAARLAQRVHDCQQLSRANLDMPDVPLHELADRVAKRPVLQASYSLRQAA